MAVYERTRTYDHRGDALTIFGSRNRAESIAKRNQKSDPDWEYRVEDELIGPNGCEGWRIDVIDEDGIKVGTL